MASKKSTKRDTNDRSVALLGMLREARAKVLQDAESFSEAATILEHVGQIISGSVCNGLDGYKNVLCNEAKKAAAIQCERVSILWNTVRKARNDSVHSGAYIRHHATRLVELLLLLEEGLAMYLEEAGDLMVRNPTTAELWQNVAAVRRAMLTNSFSFLPVQDPDGVWKLISDVSVVRYLMRAHTSNERSAALGKKVGDAIREGDIELTECKKYSSSKQIEEIKKTVAHIPALILDRDGNKERLVGILTAFDLL